ncbi:MAG: MaoC family dehydratase [Deltaproteobacteria bacterium]|nr:MaoC family dehydratase [Deltaproteobacteria bacterium]
MNLSFQQKHIQDWASMADDYNPIHFDEAAARRLGLGGIVVHGMLPLLHIKHQLSDELIASAQREWITFSSKFRQPVARDQQHQLEISTRRTGRRFALRRNEDGAEAIAGTAAPARCIEIVSPPMVSFVIDPARSTAIWIGSNGDRQGPYPARVTQDAIVVEMRLPDAVQRYTINRFTGEFDTVSRTGTYYRGTCQKVERPLY